VRSLYPPSRLQPLLPNPQQDNKSRRHQEKGDGEVKRHQIRASMVFNHRTTGRRIRAHCEVDIAREIAPNLPTVGIRIVLEAPSARPAINRQPSCLRHFYRIMPGSGRNSTYPCNSNEHPGKRCVISRCAFKDITTHGCPRQIRIKDLEIVSMIAQGFFRIRACGRIKRCLPAFKRRSNIVFVPTPLVQNPGIVLLCDTVKMVRVE